MVDEVNVQVDWRDGRHAKVHVSLQPVVEMGIRKVCETKLTLDPGDLVSRETLIRFFTAATRNVAEDEKVEVVCLDDDLDDLLKWLTDPGPVPNPIEVKAAEDG